MGQYYKVAINYLGDKDDVYYSDRRVKGCDYIMAKLMEHSYFGNFLMDAVACKLYDYVTRLAWIGDYANENDEVSKITKGECNYEDCWGEGSEKIDFEFEDNKFSYNHKYLVNMDKKVYISFDKYRKLCIAGGADKKWVLNPISILTAIGNGRGGGDYVGTNMEYVGTWAWDNITISDKADLPKDFKELVISFNEAL